MSRSIPSLCHRLHLELQRRFWRDIGLKGMFMSNVKIITVSRELHVYSRDSQGKDRTVGVSSYIYAFGPCDKNLPSRMGCATGIENCHFNRYSFGLKPSTASLCLYSMLQSSSVAWTCRCVYDDYIYCWHYCRECLYIQAH